MVTVLHMPQQGSDSSLIEMSSVWTEGKQLGSAGWQDLRLAYPFA